MHNVYHTTSATVPIIFGQSIDNTGVDYLIDDAGGSICAALMKLQMTYPVILGRLYPVNDIVTCCRKINNRAFLLRDELNQHRRPDMYIQINIKP